MAEARLSLIHRNREVLKFDMEVSNTATQTKIKPDWGASYDPPSAPEAGGWPTQALFWLEWGSSTAERGFPAARSRARAVESHSISTRPAQPVAYWRKLLHSQSSGRSHKPLFTWLR